MKIIQAADFESRVALENHVRNAVGLTSEKKENVVIQGTKAELAKLHLSEKTTFWGISCKVPAEEKPEAPAEVPDRGPKVPAGITNRLKK